MPAKFVPTPLFPVSLPLSCEARGGFPSPRHQQIPASHSPRPPACHLPRIWIAALAALSLATMPHFQAGAGTLEPIVLDFPLSAHHAYDPATNKLLTGEPAEWEAPASRRLEIPLLAVPPQQRLLAEVIFEDEPGLILRATFEPDLPSPPLLLAENLSENLPGWTSRLLLLEPRKLRGSGLLVLETNTPARRIHRVVLTPLVAAQVFAAATTAKSGSPAPEGVLSSHNLAPENWTQPEDSWEGQVAVAYLHAEPEPLQGGIEFAVEIQPAPRWGVLRFELRSQSLHPPAVKVNGIPLPHVSVAIPSLTGHSWVEPRSGALPFLAGWRSAWALLPKGVLKQGENRLAISSEQGGYVRRARLDLWFDPAPYPAASDHPPTKSLAGIVPNPARPFHPSSPAHPPPHSADQPPLDPMIPPPSPEFESLANLFRISLTEP